MRNLLPALITALILLGVGYIGGTGYWALHLELEASTPAAQEDSPVWQEGRLFQNSTQAGIHFGQQWLMRAAPYYLNMPHKVILLVTCCMMGVLGAMMRVLAHRMKGTPYADLAVPTRALMGGGMGLLVYIVCFVVLLFPFMKDQPIEYSYPAAAGLSGLFARRAFAAMAALLGGKGDSAHDEI